MIGSVKGYHPDPEFVQSFTKIIDIHIPGGDWFEEDLVERRIRIARVHHGWRFADQRTNSSGNGDNGEGAEGENSYKLKILHNWNGSNGSDAITPVEEVIKEKTGVTLEWEYTKGSETEKVNQIFATQDLPDIYTGPAWGGELDGIIKAPKRDNW